MTPGAVLEVIPARRRLLGGHQIRRVLPTRKRRMVGPVIFFDHLGPESLPAGAGIDVPPHPHIDLATVTYLFDGELDHRDSLGSLQTIRPGDVNWMHAGRGIVHSERTGVEARRAPSSIHGIQLWVAVPRSAENTDPSFTHYPAATLPTWNVDGVRIRLLVGQAFQRRSPVVTRSETLYYDAELESGSQFSVTPDVTERFVYVAWGRIRLDGTTYGESDLIVFNEGHAVRIEAETASRVLVLGGEPLDGERHIWWNFVSSSEDRIAEARKAWDQGLFPKIEGDDLERMPLPGAD
jgi:hypothetical protein